MAATLNGTGLVTSDGSTLYSNTFNTVGSHCLVSGFASSYANTSFYSGSNYSAGGGHGQLRSGYGIYNFGGYPVQLGETDNLSGTWRWLGASVTASGGCYGAIALGLAVRVA